MSVNPPRAHTEDDGLVAVCPAKYGKRVEIITSAMEIDNGVTISIVGERGGNRRSVRVHVDTLRQALLLSGIATRREEAPCPPSSE
jgi:hypothetical protein